MKKSTVFALFILMMVLLAFYYYDKLSQVSTKKIAQNTPGYNCGRDDVCSMCMYKGEVCDCGTSSCSCGDNTIERLSCE